jgi:hypothetical protein
MSLTNRASQCRLGATIAPARHRPGMAALSVGLGVTTPFRNEHSALHGGRSRGRLGCAVCTVAIVLSACAVASLAFVSRLRFGRKFECVCTHSGRATRSALSFVRCRLVKRLHSVDHRATDECIIPQPVVASGTTLRYAARGAVIWSSVRLDSCDAQIFET